MALNLGTNLFKKRTNILKTDIFKLGEISFITEEGKPIGEYKEGMLFINLADKKLYTPIDLKRNFIPTIAWYKFNNNATDYSKNKKNGIVTSSTYTTGKYKNGIILDGTDDKIELPSDLGLDWHEDWTISFWIYIPSTINNLETFYILERYIDATHYIYIKGYLVGGTNIEFYIIWNNGAGETSESMGLRPLADLEDKWIHAIFSHDSSDTSISYAYYYESDEYTNKNATVEIPNISFSGTEVYNIGYNTKNISYGDVEIYIDEFKIWNETISIIGESNSIAERGIIERLNLSEMQWISYTGEIYYE